VDSRFVKAFGLEYRVPAKRRRPTCRHDCAIGAAFKQDGFCPWSRAIRKCTQRICVFCREADKKVIQTLPKAIMEGPRLTTTQCESDASDKPSCPRFFMKCLMYGPGRPPKASKQSAVSSVMHARPSYPCGRVLPRFLRICANFNRTYQLSSSSAFRYGDFLGGSLQLRNCRNIRSSSGLYNCIRRPTCYQDPVNRSRWVCLARGYTLFPSACLHFP
jgi:hypothetical protein